MFYLYTEIYGKKNTLSMYLHFMIENMTDPATVLKFITLVTLVCIEITARLNKLIRYRYQGSVI